MSTFINSEPYLALSMINILKLKETLCLFAMIHSLAINTMTQVSELPIPPFSSAHVLLSSFHSLKYSNWKYKVNNGLWFLFVGKPQFAEFEYHSKLLFAQTRKWLSELEERERGTGRAWGIVQIGKPWFGYDAWTGSLTIHEIKEIYLTLS